MQGCVCKKIGLRLLLNSFPPPAVSNPDRYLLDQQAYGDTRAQREREREREIERERERKKDTGKCVCVGGGGGGLGVDKCL